MKGKKGRKGQPLRVIQACDLQAGGITSLILSICEQLDREKVNFDYLVYRNQPEFGDEKVKEYGGKKLIADNTDAPNQMARFLWKFWRTWKVLKEEQVEIFHINAPTPYDCLVGIAAKLAGARVVVLHSHNSRLKKPGVGHRIFQEICRFCLPLCGDYYFACSDLAGEFMYGKRPRKRIVYVKNGIDTEYFRFDEEYRNKMREDYGIGDALVFGNIGRLCEQKNQRFLLYIFAEIRKIKPDAKLILIGQGELEAELSELADSLGIRDNLIRIAATEHVREYLCMMDGFLLPSLFEGLPVVGVEAQASGLPCVFSDSITREVSLSDRAHFLSLKRSAQDWARFAVAMAEAAKENRKVYADVIKSDGFEIKDTARWLQNFYLESLS
ncbi:MAG: glycosyltransferase family 1 protein [Hespellia sp.]|nr:glycosyltransferase family 1 protein [Hespellia sp.]